jgi:hypothetical protein
VPVTGTSPPKKALPFLIKSEWRKGDRFMNGEEKKQDENDKPLNLTPQPLKVSKVIYDEATGTVTLRLATEEEIAGDERLKAERLKKERKD